MYFSDNKNGMRSEVMIFTLIETQQILQPGTTIVVIYGGRGVISVISMMSVISVICIVTTID